jgi:hypothetical protein
MSTRDADLAGTAASLFGFGFSFESQPIKLKKWDPEYRQSILLKIKQQRKNEDINSFEVLQSHCSKSITYYHKID